MNHLNELRNQINILDKEILSLLYKRGEVAKQVVHFKQEHNLEIFQTEREQELLQEKIHLLPEELTRYQEEIKQIYQQIMDLSKEIQKQELSIF